MNRRQAFIMVSQILPTCGPATPAGVYLTPENILPIQPPANMICTRLTIQVQGPNDYASAPVYSEIVVNNNPPKHGADGIKLTTLYDINALSVIPANFVLEDFSDLGITGTLYVAANTDNTPICILYEGFYK